MKSLKQYVHCFDSLLFLSLSATPSKYSASTLSRSSYFSLALSDSNASFDGSLILSSCCSNFWCSFYTCSSLASLSASMSFVRFANSDLNCLISPPFASFSSLSLRICEFLAAMSCVRPLIWLLWPYYSSEFATKILSDLFLYSCSC